MTIREITTRDITAAIDLARAAFNKYIAPEYSQQGIDEFMKTASPEAMAERLQKGNFAYIAELDGTLAGIIEVRDGSHISLFAVDPSHLRHGIGRRLFETAAWRITSTNPGIPSITVNSSPFAVPIYTRLGFKPTGPQQQINGIVFTPMKIDFA